MERIPVKGVAVRKIDGEILYDGEARSLKEFIQDLVKRGMSLAGTDLRGLNLTHLDLEGGDFAGAWLDGADLRGAVARKASFSGASMRGVRADGIQADRSDFSGADLSPCPDTGKASSLDGAILTYSAFRGTDLTGVKARGVAASSTDFTGAKVIKAEFDGATMHNAEWQDATVVSTSFRRANLEPTLRIDEAHMPDRTDGATVAGNNLRNARIGTGNSAFRMDAVAGRASRYGSWAALTAGVAWTGTTLPLDVDLDAVGEAVGQGAAFVAVATATVLLKELVEDLFKDTVGGWLTETDAVVRKGLSRMVSKGKNLAGLAVALCSPGVGKALRRALRASGMSAWSAVGIEVVVADRRRLARALSELSRAWASGSPPPNDVVVLRPAGTGGPAPHAVVCRSDGSVTCVWTDGKTDSVRTWIGGKAGDWNGWPTARMKEALDSFMRAACLDVGLPELDFDPESHAVRVGRDGSAVVVRRADGRLQNPYGPVIVTPCAEFVWRPGEETREEPVAGCGGEPDNRVGTQRRTT